MIASGGQLRAITRRKMFIDGPHNISPANNSIMFREFEIIGPDGKSRKRVEADERVLLATRASVKMLDNVALIHVNPDLYTVGTLNGATVRTPEDGDRPITFWFTPIKRVDASEIAYLCSLHICE